MPSRPTFALPRLRPIYVGQLGGLALATALAVVVLTRGADRSHEAPSSATRMNDAVARVDDRVYAQHYEASYLATDNTAGAPLLSP